MKLITRSLLIPFFAALLLYGSVEAGRLSDELAQKVAGLKDTDPVRVWIKLPEVITASSLEVEVGAKASTRAQRYQLTVARLRENHTVAQLDLLTHLRSLRQNKHAVFMPPKGHWLVNIVEAEVAVEDLWRLAMRPDVETIYPVPQAVSIVPDEMAPAPALATGVEDNLAYINAPAAWAAGYTGTGRIVCSFDTGVDGFHPALFDNWKGHDGDPAAAWFDPAGGEPFPHDLPGLVMPPSDSRHGTHVTGIIVGHDDASGDTVGVAPGARWISAAVIDVQGTSVIDAFEWAADPDGDANSLDDVPDVINHSWGVPNAGCENIFYTMIDNTEALGIVNIFSAGNEGSALMSIRNPANRADDSLDCFATGNIDYRTDLISVSSSRGPSDCDFRSIKPNVVAPGVGIRSCVPDGYYNFFSGTSMAAPHVSGLVALLRQKNPNATVDEIKNAILLSTDNLGRSLPDNIYGWGLIDCLAALNALPAANPEPNVRVFSFDHAPIEPGDVVIGTLVLKNLGAAVTGVTATLAGGNDALTVLAGTAGFGTIAEGQTVAAQSSFRVEIADTVSVGSVLSLDLSIEGDGYSTSASLYFVVEPVAQRSFVTHNTGTVEFSLSNYGTYGLGEGSFFPAGGVGFRFMGNDNDIFDGGLMIGTGLDQVSDGVWSPVGQPDADFGVISGGEFDFIPPFEGVSQQSFARFNDARAEDPIGVTVEQHSYCFNYAPYQDLVILQYILRNTGEETLTNLYVGLHFDWDVVLFGSNAGGFESSEQFAWVAYHEGSMVSQYRGVKVLHGELVTVYTDTTNMIACPPAGFECYFNSVKLNALRRGLSSPTAFRDGFNDLFQVVAARTNLAAGELDTVTFALIAGETLADIRGTANAATEAYVDIILEGVPPPPPPPLVGSFALRQNRPNPFNHGTVIPFNLRTTTNYTLSVYNVLGRKVREYTGRGGPGEVEIEFDTRGLASGVYLYRLEAGGFRASRKMVLIKR